MARRGGPSLGLLLAALACSPPGARAQAVGAPAELADATAATGAGVVLQVRVGDPTALAGSGPPAAPGAAAAGGRPEGVRLVSAQGTPAPAPARFEAESGYGVYAFRADLPTPGAWTLSFTLRRPARPDTPVVLVFIAQERTRAPLRADPAGPALVAADPAQPVQPAPAATAPR